MHQAVRRGYVRVTEFLLTMGTDVNQRGEDDHTPVFIATGRGDVDMVRFLVERGADPSLRDTVIGRNAWDLANEADKGIRNALFAALNAPPLNASTTT
ncbi:MAG: ankyrin repeat domain-containing protein [Planctomycetaceae bacterium]